MSAPEGIGRLARDRAGKMARSSRRGVRTRDRSSAGRTLADASRQSGRKARPGGLAPRVQGGDNELRRRRRVMLTKLGIAMAVVVTMLGGSAELVAARGGHGGGDGGGGGHFEHFRGH